MNTACTGISRGICPTASRIAAATSSARVSSGRMKITISASIPSQSASARIVPR